MAAARIRSAGETFAAETDVLICEHGRNGYAAQTYSDTPDGRRIQISWMAHGRYPDMPFNQQMSFPVELALLGAGDDVTLARWPIAEIETLRHHLVTADAVTVSSGAPFAPACRGSLYDVAFDVLSAAPFRLTIRGETLGFDFSERVLRMCGKEVPLPAGSTLPVRMLIDRTSIEVFLDGGRVSASFCFLPGAHDRPVVFTAEDEDVAIAHLEIHELKGIWSV